MDPAVLKRVGVIVAALALIGASTAVWFYLQRSKGTVVLVGDSLLFQSNSEFQAQFGDRGWDVRFVGGAGTGPLDLHHFWARDLTAQVEAHDPKVVVLEACCNYRGPFVAADGSPVPPDSPAMYQEWAKATQDLADRARARGAKVFWVLTPPAKTTNPAYADYPQRIERFNQQYRFLKGVTLIDWGKSVAPFGFSPTLPGPDGKPIEVRVADGLHLTQDGAALVAEQTWQAVAPALKAG